VGLGIDWLRREGTEGENNPAPWGGLAAGKNPATGEVFFS